MNSLIFSDFKEMIVTIEDITEFKMTVDKYDSKM